jgi:hypothetical protein
MADHPLVGTWFVAEAQEPDDSFMISFLSDGVAIQLEGSGVAAFGVWEATGPTTANATFHTRFEDEEYAEVITIRAAFDVAPDGLTLTGEYTAQIVTPDGDDVGELGPGAVVGTRMVVEPMGTPVASFDDGGDMPEASPEG